MPLPLTKEMLLNHIHTLVSKNVLGDKQLMQRYKGFRSELLSNEIINAKFPIHYHSGYYISLDSRSSALENSIFYIMAPDSVSDESYIKVFHALHSLGFNKMYFIKYDMQRLSSEVVMSFANETISLPVPFFSVFEYSDDFEVFKTRGHLISYLTDNFEDIRPRSKNKHLILDDTRQWLMDELSGFSIEDLTQLYVERLVFDGFIGFGKVKGKPADIDKIAKGPDDNLYFLEIKEKDLPKYHTKGFGLDVPRLDDMKNISDRTGIPYLLIVRQVDNQKDRNLLDWWCININDFEVNVRLQPTVEGGTGMRSSYSNNPTKICPLEHFSRITL